MNFLKFKNKKLFYENIAISKIANKIKTPFYLYSLSQLRFNFTNFKKTFRTTNPIICFSVKSNSNLRLLSELKKLGSGADVVSIGELKIALKAGISPKKIVFSGVGKTEEELDFAIKKEILLINAESEAEIITINRIAKKNNKIVSVGIRINPNISGKTNKKISTGKKDNKFGVTMNACLQIFNNQYHYEYIKFEAISVHIGSQIMEINPFKKVLNALSDFNKKINQIGISLKYIDLGGGTGIPYSDDEKNFNLKEYSNLVFNFKKTNNVEIIFEPGRSICGNTGILVSKVIYLKDVSKKKFVIIDGDDIRELYKNTDYSVEGRKANVDFVQKLCTFLIKNEIVPVVCMVSPFAEQRRKFIEENNGIEIYVYCNEIRGRENYHVDYYEKPIESEISVNLDTTNKNVKQSFNELWKIIS